MEQDRGVLAAAAVAAAVAVRAAEVEAAWADLLRLVRGGSVFVRAAVIRRRTRPVFRVVRRLAASVERE